MRDGCCCAPSTPNSSPVSVRYTAPSGPWARSLSIVEPLTVTDLIGAPVRALNARATRMSATHKVSPMRSSPFGALSVTPLRPPAMNCSESILPLGRIRLMKPLLSSAAGEPLMFETNHTSCSPSYRAASGVENPVTVVTSEMESLSAAVVVSAAAVSVSSPAPSHAPMPIPSTAMISGRAQRRVYSMWFLVVCGE